MDSSFTFPRPQAPQPRTQPLKSAGSTTVRESNALRASVLDVALQLGIGNNSLVADWMFNNAVTEEDEGEYQVSSPSLTYGSSATSEESSSSALTPSSSISSSKYSGAGAAHAPYPRPGLQMGGMVQINEAEADVPNFDNFVSNAFSFTDVPIPQRPTTPVSRKLKKKQRPDGYESDGGYLSEGPVKRKEKKGAPKDSITFPSLETDREREVKKRAKEEKKEGDEKERKPKKSLISVVKSKKSDRKDAAEPTKSYDTDGGGISSNKKIKPKKSKSKLLPENNDGGYETDSVASTPVKKSKTRFFKLSNKSSRPNLRVEPVPEMPAPKEVVPLPIAERFATTLSQTSFSPSASVGSTPSPTLERLPTPLPPLSFQPFEGSSSKDMSETRVSPTTSLQYPTNRGSQGSAESSSSNGFRSQMESASTLTSSHGQGSGSYSTLTSSQNHYTSGSTTSSSILPSPPNSGRIGDPGSLALPTISFPNTRSASPNPTSPPVASFQITANLRMKPSLEGIGLMARGDVSPSPISPISPIMGIPLRSVASSPSMKIGPPSPLPTPRSSSPLPGRQTDKLAIPRSPGGQLPSRSPSPYGYGQISAPLSATEIHTPRPSQLTIPGGDPHSQTPSPRHSGLHSPNVLAYYDIPAPSPPPMGPLPTIPPYAANGNGNGTGNNQQPANANANPGHFPPAALLRQRVIDRTPRQLPPEIGSLIQAQANIQRGKESPFPSRPLLPGGSLPTSGLGLGRQVESRVTGTARYRDVYPQAGLSPALNPESLSSGRYNGEMEDDGRDGRRTRFRDDLSFISANTAVTGTTDASDPAENLRDVLDRYDDGSRADEDAAEETTSVPYEMSLSRSMSRSRSMANLNMNESMDMASGYTHPQARPPRAAPPAPIPSAMPEARETLYQFDDDGRTVGDRTSRWSGSIYSRASFLDEDASGKTRERLVNQVERMLEMEGRRGGGGGGYIPPVPRLPEEYANSQAAAPARGWNRF